MGSTDQKYVQLTVVMCMLVGVTFGSIWFWRQMGNEQLQHWALLKWAGLFFAFLSALLVLLGAFWQYAGQRFTPEKRLLYRTTLTLCIIAISEGLSLGLLYMYLKLMHHWRQIGPQGAFHAEVWEPALLFTVLVIPGIFQVGLMGVDFPDSGRDWMSRHRAVCTMYPLYWIGLLGAAIYGPLLASWLVQSSKNLVSAALVWAGSTVFSFLAGSSDKTGKGKDDSRRSRGCK